jgi:hypothetical protein
MRLTLEALARVDRLVVAPRPVHPPMVGCLRPVFCLEPVHEIAHVLCARARHHHDGIGGVHDDEILDADQCRKAIVGVHHAVT